MFVLFSDIVILCQINIIIWSFRTREMC